MIIYTVELKNQPGEMAHMCEVLGHGGVNIEVCGVTMGDRGVVCFTADDESAATAALEGGGIEYTGHQALRVTCDDQPGEVARFSRKLANAGVNLEWLIPVSICQGEDVFAVCVDKIDAARGALAGQVSG